MRAVRRRRLTTGEARSAAAALGPLIAVDLALRIVGFRRTQRLTRALARPARAITSTADPRHDPRAAAAVAAVDRAAHLYRPGAMCLRRTLVLQAWLRRRGYETGIALGLRPADDGPPVAHAWLIWRDAPVFEHADPADYVRFRAYGSES